EDKTPPYLTPRSTRNSSESCLFIQMTLIISLYHSTIIPTAASSATLLCHVLASMPWSSMS
ncbi:hypothetical protein QOT17_001301, partial [Balamuthia mandrillaris]